jgi:hypothetical protein
VGRESASIEKLKSEGRRLGPWFLQVDVADGLTTADFSPDPGDADAAPGPLGRVRMHDPRERFTRTLAAVYPEGLGQRSVLDCACNCGGYLFWAREHGAGRCVGFDVREHWIAQARFLAEHRSSPSDDMRFEACDLYELPKMGLDPFDVTLFNGIFYHLPDPIEGLRIAAETARELLVVQTSTRTGLPDGMLTISEESLTRGVSGVYGLAWFPTGPRVLADMIRWMGFPEVRCTWWSRRADQPPGHGRIEMVAARDPSTLAAYDAALGAPGPERVPAVVETTVSPEALVLVVSPGGDPVPQLDGREAQRFPETAADGEPGDEGAALVAELERLRCAGADYLVVPAGAGEWVEARPALRRHLRRRCELVADEPGTCSVHLL